MGSFTAELRRFIERLKIMEDDSRVMKRNLIVLRQGMRDAWTDSTRNPCLTTITGKVVGCDTAAAPLPNSLLRIVGHTSGIAYGTFTITSGTFTLDLILADADTSLDCYATGPGVRFAESPARVRAVTHCASNALAAIATAPATGYHCTSEFVYPLADTINIVDSVYGNWTATWSGGNWVTPSTNTVTLGSGTCPSATTPLSFILQNAATFQIFPAWKSVTSSSCPNLAGPSTGTGGVLNLSSGTGNGPGVSTKMDYTVTWPAVGSPSTHIYGGGTATTRAYEP